MDYVRTNTIINLSEVLRAIVDPKNPDAPIDAFVPYALNIPAWAAAAAVCARRRHRGLVILHDTYGYTIRTED